jgi:hypothetical protein
VIQRRCHRCQLVLHVEEEGSLTFCWNCGAPQVTLSEELQEQALAQRTDVAAASQTPDATETEEERVARIAAQPPDLLMIWKAAIRISAAVAAGVSVICVILPLQFLAWMAPSLVLSIYCAKYRQTRITAAVGARVGLVCGILCGLGISVAETIQILMLRLGLHNGSDFDSTMNSMLLQAKARTAAGSGQAAADLFYNPIMGIPEFRVGFFLFLLAGGLAILLVLSTASGAFSGYMRSRAPAR